MAGKQHYTHNTVSVRKWCNECARFTDHAVAGGQVGHCLEQHRRAGRNLCALADWFCAHRLNTSQTASLIWIDTGIQFPAMEAM